MTPLTTRKLALLTGIASLLAAGWLAFDRYSRHEESLVSDPSVRINHSRSESAKAPQATSDSRSLEELNEILFKAAEEWRQLAGSRYFFEDYADEVVSKFSPNEISILGFEATRIDQARASLFAEATIRRWGEVEFLEGEVRFEENLRALIEKEAERQKMTREANTGYPRRYSVLIDHLKKTLSRTGSRKIPR